MKIYVLRHGNAVNEAPSDKQRPLSDKGKAQLKKISEMCADELADLDYILVSPYLRAQQTLDELRKCLPVLNNIETITSDDLRPSGSVGAVVESLSHIDASLQCQSVLLVSHQPLVGVLVDALCDLEPGCYRMGTAALAKMQFEGVARNSGALQWIKHPQG